MVKRPAAGAAGFVLDHYDSSAIANHLHAVGDRLLSAFGDHPPYAVFSDSLEDYASNWTPDLLAEFERRRGYDLTPLIPALVGDFGQASRPGTLSSSMKATSGSFRLLVSSRSTNVIRRTGTSKLASGPGPAWYSSEVDPSLHRLSRDRVRAEDETASSGLREELGDVPVRNDHALRDQPAGPPHRRSGWPTNSSGRPHTRLQSRLQAGAGSESPRRGSSILLCGSKHGRANCRITTSVNGRVVPSVGAG